MSDPFRDDIARMNRAQSRRRISDVMALLLLGAFLAIAAVFWFLPDNSSKEAKAPEPATAGSTPADR